ncbi:MAG: 16S rRNA (guanine(527)-N(7))-methyltransferase RsmG [Pseudomonadota bacterium]
MPSDVESLAKPLKQGIVDLHLAIDSSAQAALLDYLALLVKWNRIYNLTAVRDPRQMLGKHLLDSLSVLPYINGDELLDVGTGAGLPGVPLAIARPELAVTLLDSNSKKTRFLQQVKSQLGLDNVKVAHRRVEQFQPVEGFATVTSRAFASILEFDAMCGRLCSAQGVVVAMLGQAPTHDERESLGDRLLSLDSVEVPDVDGVRHIARIRP